MQLNEEQIKSVRKSFAAMQGKEDLLSLLNFIKPLLYGADSHPFNIVQLNYHANPRINPRRYAKFEIEKKSGAKRVILAPNKGLKAIQKCLNLILQSVYDVNPAAKGFVPGRSILDNAKVHTNNIYVYNIDLKDFFPSIDQARVWGRLKFAPFNLNERNGRLEIANIIAALCCHNFPVLRLNQENEWENVHKNALPQGAPTSPTITNIVCQQLDFYLTAVAKRFGINYSRYADDITFSSMHNVFQKESAFIKELRRIIQAQNFNVNAEKTRLQKRGYRQEVTGLIVNDKVNVTKKRVKELRMWLYYWEHYGYGVANEWFKKKCIDGKLVKKSNTGLSQMISGNLSYLKMIKGPINEQYIKLKERHEALGNHQKTYQFKAIKIDDKTEFNHRPWDTVKILKLFKYDSGFAFKDLVHKPIDEDDFNYLNVLKRANEEFLQISLSAQGNVNLPEKLTTSVQSLFGLLSNEGLKYFLRTGLHPLNDKVVGAEIQHFKQNYRFGNEKTESSVLSSLILNVALSERRRHHDQNDNVVYAFGPHDTSGLFGKEQIIFTPDLVKFQTRANFFTWVPNVRLVLVLIFDSILKHSNIYGNRDFVASEKKIIIDLKRTFEGEVIKVDLSITDHRSIFIGNISKIMQDLRRDFYPLLNGICDFRVEFSTGDEEAFQCRILPFGDLNKLLENSVSGYKYVFTFYD